MEQFKEFIPFIIFAIIAILRGLNQANKEKAKKSSKEISNSPTAQPKAKPTWSAPAGQPTPSKSATPYQTVGPPPVKKSPFEVIMEEFMEIPSTKTDQPAEPQYKRDYREPKHEKPIVRVDTNEIKPAKIKTTDYTNIENKVEEVVRAKAAHSGHAHKFESFDAYREHEEHVDFDLRDAVIKSVVLERYQY
ncbi:hypothetical protein C3K47_07180 [Solitalea longa]|uniref:Uncharacterized protein n=1 Tax=Solitalea longa TaxID=2079460 RepID=A0A2S5A4L8_9SPHI|nr:hypothetical protein [Solitalea longa]POY37540.1 hypothetical protein C3K47_07180 [Solitalea longa]